MQWTRVGSFRILILEAGAASGSISRQLMTTQGGRFAEPTGVDATELPRCWSDQHAPQNIALLRVADVDNDGKPRRMSS